MMIKKILLCILCLSLALSLCAFAENETEETVTEQQTVQEEMPMQRDRGMGGGRMGGGPPGSMSEGMQPPQMPEGENMQGEDMQPPQMPQDRSLSEQNAENTENTENTENSEITGAQPPQENGNMGEGFPGEMTVENQPAQDTVQEEDGSENILKKYSTPILSVILLAAAFVFVIFYKRKIY